VLSAMRDQLSGDYLLGDELSYADMAMAAAMQFVKPVDTRFIRLGPASLTCWTEPELRDRYPELLEWRDAVYARDRLPE
jgi:glutathione S-transferase